MYKHIFKIHKFHIQSFLGSDGPLHRIATELIFIFILYYLVFLIDITNHFCELFNSFPTESIMLISISTVIRAQFKPS